MDYYLSDGETYRPSSFTDSTALLNNPSALRQRAAEEGYLFFKQFLPKGEIFALRAEMLAVVEKYGWRKKGQDSYGGRIDLEALNQVPEEKMRTDIGVSTEAYQDVQRLERFHRLPHHPRLLSLYRILFAKDIMVHARHIGRMITAHKNVFPTPPHQDFPLIQGTANTWTCWFPIGDCPRELGGLTVLRGSNRYGYLPIQPAKGAGGIAVPLCSYDKDWVEGDFESGDILTFSSYTIHRALRCQHKEQIRLSLDVRYQPIDEPVETKSLLPHCDLIWEEIYAGWEKEDLKYYWRDLPIQSSPWNDDYLQPKRRIC
jgi:ectoine hydroxylase-related dioxygenase (phytanoyl-CoA dioxygenase family)